MLSIKAMPETETPWWRKMRKRPDTWLTPRIVREACYTRDESAYARLADPFAELLARDLLGRLETEL